MDGRVESAAGWLVKWLIGLDADNQHLQARPQNTSYNNASLILRLLHRRRRLQQEGRLTLYKDYNAHTSMDAHSGCRSTHWPRPSVYTSVRPSPTQSSTSTSYNKSSHTTTTTTTTATAASTTSTHHHYYYYSSYFYHHYLSPRHTHYDTPLSLHRQ